MLVDCDFGFSAYMFFCDSSFLISYTCIGVCLMDLEFELVVSYAFCFSSSFFNFCVLLIRKFQYVCVFISVISL